MNVKVLLEKKVVGKAPEEGLSTSMHHTESVIVSMQMSGRDDSAVLEG